MRAVRPGLRHRIRDHRALARALTYRDANLGRAGRGGLVFAGVVPRPEAVDLLGAQGLPWLKSVRCVRGGSHGHRYRPMAGRCAGGRYLLGSAIAGSVS